MKVIRFSFKSEPIWMLLFSLAPIVVGLLIFLVLDRTDTNKKSTMPNAKQK